MSELELPAICNFINKLKPAITQLPAKQFAQLVMRVACEESPLYSKIIKHEQFFQISMPFIAGVEPVVYNPRNAHMHCEFSVDADKDCEKETRADMDLREGCREVWWASGAI